MYRPNQCTEAHCTKTREGDGLCAEHLWRWAFRCEHTGDEHERAHTHVAA